MLRQPFQILLGVDRRHAAGAGGGNRLTVDVILDVARGEDARDVGARAVVRQDVAVRVHLELTLEERRVRRVADRDEHAVDASVFRSPVSVFLSTMPVHFALAAVVDVVDFAVPLERDLRVGERLVLHDLRRAQRVAAMDDGDLRGELA